MTAMDGRPDVKDELLEAGLSLASELSLPIVLQRIVDLAAQVTDARYAALGVIGPDGSLVEFVTTGISSRQRNQIGALPRGRGILGHLVKHPKPLRLRDLGKHARSVGFPEHHPPMRSFLGAPIVAMGKVYGNIYLTEKREADEFSADDERSLIVLASQAGVAIANASLYEEMRQREVWLDSLREITGEILGGTDADSLLARITDDARNLARAQTAVLVSRAAVGGELIVSAAVGQHVAGLQGKDVPADRSISGEVMASGKALIFEDASAQRNAYPPIMKTAKVGPAIFVPLRVRGRATGTLMVANQKGGPAFDERTLRLVETFADQASVAIEYSRAQADLRRLGVMDDRERIAKDLHDGIIQSLFAVGMGLQATALIAASPDVSNRIEAAVNELDRVIRDLRNYIFGLRPGILADRGLDEAIRTLGIETHGRSHIKVEVDVDAKAASLLAGRSHDIVQLTREALSNVVRHANARRARVELMAANGRAVLTVEDDGDGFDARTPGAGNGLQNMRQRAAGLGGELRISSQPGKGTRLRITIPY